MTDANTALDGPARRAVVADLLGKLRDNYVFPDVAIRMSGHVEQRLRAGSYDDARDGTNLAARLTADLREISHDLHLRVRFSCDPLPPVERSDPWDDPAFYAEYQRKAVLLRNVGIQRVERLPGNVGYIHITTFDDARVMADTAVAAMTFVATMSALIIDLRSNGGGDPFAVALVTTYLFGPEPVHLNDMYNRPKNRTDQFWTLPHVPGHRLGPDKPVYVLTSNRTFSAGEEFAYNLQHLARATLVGERTAGGANPLNVFRLTPHFEAYIPTGRAINPVTGTNWEGVGVVPDVAVPSDDALSVAHRLALAAIKDTFGTQREAPEQALNAEIEAALEALGGEGMMPE